MSKQSTPSKVVELLERNGLRLSSADGSALQAAVNADLTSGVCTVEKARLFRKCMGLVVRAERLQRRRIKLGLLRAKLATQAT